MADAIFLIDGSAFAYRSFFAIPSLTNSEGQPTNAAYGFTRVLIKILREHEPSHIAVMFDAKGKTFRHDMYDSYKANRPEMPADLASQLPLIDEVICAFNIPLIRIDGVEADDVIGTLARRAEEAGMEAVVVTGDKDALQLVTDRVKVFDPNRGDNGTWYGRAEVRERYGVGPEGIIDIFALMGDSSDNVPGVKGVGEKTARKLLEEHGTLDGVYAHLDTVKGKLKERLQTERDMAYLSRRLVTIDTGVALPFGLDDCRRGTPDRQQVMEIFGKLDFHTLLDEVLPEAEQTEETCYETVATPEKLRQVVDEMRAAGACAVDTETTSTDPMRARLVGVSLCCEAARAYYIPVGHTVEAQALLVAEGAPPEQLPPEDALRMLKPLLEDPAILKSGHNIKYDLVVLRRAGIEMRGVEFDTMVASYLTDPSRLRHNLSEVCLYYLKRKMIPITDLIGKGSKAVTFDKVPIDQACTYASEDADIAWRLTKVFRPILHERGLDTLFHEVELPLIDVLACMEQTGIAIDPGVFASMQSEVENRLKDLESSVYEAAGETFQINSPKQLQGILFGKLGLKPLRRTKTGHSTDVDVLEQLAEQHALPKLILEYRMLEKLRGTYIEALPKLVHPETGRIHTSFNQAVAATGRLSSSDPNLQNIPIRTEIGRRIRQGFVPGDPGRRLISADYSQIELRILAHLSGDAGLKEAFAEDKDIHRDTAARIFGIMPELVTSEMRRQAKAVNFGVVYGISAFGLARNIGISNREAERFIEQYFAEYPAVRQWIADTLAEARQCGFVTTLLNRRRYVPDLKSGDMNRRRAAERVAMNTPVQGSAADLIKLAMIRLHEALRESGAALLLQVHDELVIEAPAAEADAVAGKAREIMENAMRLDVPLKVDVGVGDNWAEIH